jgi:hypothetical protein
MLNAPDRAKLAAAARAHAASLSWDAAMRTLFDRVFPAALARRAALFNGRSVVGALEYRAFNRTHNRRR